MNDYDFTPPVSDAVETRVCAMCGRELPITSYHKIRGGKRLNTCNDCVTAKRRETRAAKMEAAKAPYPGDPEFDGKEPREVIDTMIRCRRWLESKGYKIEMSCQYTEVKVHTINCK